METTLTAFLNIFQIGGASPGGSVLIHGGGSGEHTSHPYSCCVAAHMLALNFFNDATSRVQSLACLLLRNCYDHRLMSTRTSSIETDDVCMMVFYRCWHAGDCPLQSQENNHLCHCWQVRAPLPETCFN